jgi:hypothetical protein
MNSQLLGFVWESFLLSAFWAFFCIVAIRDGARDGRRIWQQIKSVKNYVQTDGVVVDWAGTFTARRVRVAFSGADGARHEIVRDVYCIYYDGDTVRVCFQYDKERNAIVRERVSRFQVCYLVIFSALTSMTGVVLLIPLVSDLLSRHL